MEILVAVTVAFAAFIALAVLAFAAWGVYKFWAVLKDIRNQLALFNSNVNGVPVLLEGIKGICTELASNTVAMSTSVNVLKRSLIDETSDPRRGPGIMQYDDNAADRAWREQQLAQSEALMSEESNRFIVTDG